MPAVAAAAIAGGAAITGSVISSKSQSKSQKRALSAQEKAAAKAEAFELDQDTRNRAERERQDADEAKRYAVDQANIARKQAQEDALLADSIERANYEDAIRYGKMVRLAELTGNPAPPPLPKRTAGLPTQTAAPQQAQASGLVPTRASTANAMISGPGGATRMPLSALSSGGFMPESQPDPWASRDVVAGASSLPRYRRRPLMTQGV